jgi:hypothetical protein
VLKIVSGGQSGVDRAALDVALELGVPCGGWCPRGRVAEDGRIARRYPLRETPSASYGQRTRWNVRDSDATLILNLGHLSGGTRLTVEIAATLGRPWRLVDLADPPTADMLAGWIRARAVEVLNVAGPRESGRPGAYLAAARFLRGVLAAIVR